MVKSVVQMDEKNKFLRIMPSPTAEEVNRYYAEEFYARKNSNYVNDSSRENMEEEAEYHRRCFSDFYDLMLQNIPQITRQIGDFSVLDVGCGYGYWLRYLQELNIKVQGVEPVQEGVDECLKAGIKAYCVPVEKMAEVDLGGRVDLVSMINVLEHLREPDKILSALRENCLHKGGYLLLKVPNDFNQLQVAANQVHQLNDWWVIPPRHLNYFSFSSLASFLARCGYEVVDQMSTFPLEMFLLMGDVYVGDSNIGKVCHRRRVNFERNMDDSGLKALRHSLYRDFANRGVGREILMIARALK